MVFDGFQDNWKMPHCVLFILGKPGKIGFPKQLEKILSKLAADREAMPLGSNLDF